MVRRVVGLGIAMALWSGCATVRPWERERLASPAMERAVDDTELTAEYRAKVIESRTAGGVAGDAPGGGCGCTQ
jgi:hypothetical protein